MTLKQEHIVDSAIKLFAKDGFHATSTSKIAKDAEVSEGLIFRHYKNKEGLLTAIIHKSELTINQSYSEILKEADPKDILRKIIELPFLTDMMVYKYWTLSLRLKWELGLDTFRITKPLQKVLETAFTKLRYKRPALEAEFLMRCLESLFATLMNDTIESKQTFKEFLFQKYHIEEL